ncbi:MAG: beta strand repeat-containing protein [Beijerinckiaceae bacterium]
MAMHQTFTSNQALATLLGPMVLGGSPLPGEATWSGSVSLWSGDVISVTATKIVVRFPLNGLPNGITGVDIEVFGTTTYEADPINGGMRWNGMNVTSAEWTPINSTELLARWTFDAARFFARDMSVSSGGINQFFDFLSFGQNQNAFWNDIFDGNDSLVGAGAHDSLRGGVGNDTIDGKAGSDTLEGDTGDDTFIYRKDDATSGEELFGGDGIDRIFASGAQATGNLMDINAVNISALNFNSIEQVWTNGTELVTNAGQFSNNGGFNTVVGKSGVMDTLTIVNAVNWDFSQLTFNTWDSQDLVGIIGSGANETIIGSVHNDAIVGGDGADSMSGGLGDDRFILFGTGVLPSDTINGGDGQDVLQVGEAGQVLNIRNLSLTGIEKLDHTGGQILISASDLSGSFAPGATAPATGKISTISGGNAPSMLQIEMGNTLEGLTLSDTVFQNWNDDPGTIHVISINAGTATTGIIGAKNEATQIIGTGALQSVTIIGGLNSDNIRGSNLDDFILSDGLEESDVGYAGDFVNGEYGNDLIGGSNADDTLMGSFGNDTINGDKGNDALTGDAGNDVLDGGDGNDSVDGGADFDRVFGGAGNDTLTGGAANDWFGYTTGADVITDFVADGTEDFIDLRALPTVNSLSAVLALGTQVGANTVLTFSAGNTLTLNNVTLGSLTAADFLLAAGSNAINGTAGADSLVGTAGNDTINGLGGNDTLNGAGGNDIFFGGTGDDTFVVDSNLDSINEVSGEGTDTVNSSAAFTQLDAGNTLENLTYTGTANGTLYGNGLGNVLTGGNNSDNLNGFFGVDVMYGGDGDDYLYIDEQDFLNGGAGYDAVYIQTTVGTVLNVGVSQVEYVVGYTGNDVLNGSTSTVSVALLGGAGVDILRGGSANDYIYFDSLDTLIDAGGGNNDVVSVYNDNNGVTLNITAANAEYVIGGNGGDVLNAAGSINVVTIQGGAGADTITGGNASDYLYGNAGADVFRVTVNAQLDAVLDFVDAGGAEDDRINVSALGANFDTIAEILAATTETSGTSVIDFGGGNQLYLFQIAKTSLTADDFIF